MPFTLVDPHSLPADPVAAEDALLARAEALPAYLWEAPVSLVVPRSYRRHAALEAARARFAAEGCTVHLRPSGGGLVPQGPGILNLSLAYPVRGTPGEWSGTIYRHLCDLLREALGTFGVATHWQAVEGSFCDGRFNLAWGEGAAARKIAGTAQYWRPLPAEPGLPRRHAVLSHAVLLVDPDLAAAHARANAFEQAIASGRRYDAARTVSVAQALAAQGAPVPPALMAHVRQALHAALAASQPPSPAGQPH